MMQQLHAAHQHPHLIRRLWEAQITSNAQQTCAGKSNQRNWAIQSILDALHNRIP
jgi:hypothetical protein